MKCERMREIAALVVSGDAAADQRREFEEHAAGCAACREEAEAIRAVREALEEIGAEEPEAVSCATVRARVMEEIAGRRRRAAWGWWAAAMAAGACAAVVVWMVTVRPAKVVPAARPAVARSVEAKAAQSVAPAMLRERPRRTRARRARAVQAQPMLVKLESEDPNVVIYWITSGTGD